MNEYQVIIHVVILHATGTENCLSHLKHDYTILSVSLRQQSLFDVIICCVHQLFMRSKLSIARDVFRILAG